jgi:hypothetical protein
MDQTPQVVDYHSPSRNGGVISPVLRAAGRTLNIVATLCLLVPFSAFVVSDAPWPGGRGSDMFFVLLMGAPATLLGMTLAAVAVFGCGAKSVGGFLPLVFNAFAVACYFYWIFFVASFC